MRSWAKDRQASVHLMEATLEDAAKRINERFDIVYAYGILYHLSNPGAALQFMSNACSGLLLLETCVSLGEELSVNPTKEDGAAPSQAIGGMGCRPTRPWLWRELSRLFEFVYATATQPAHEEFPTGWTVPRSESGLTRSVFVASRRPLESDLLLDHLPAVQLAYSDKAV